MIQASSKQLGIAAQSIDWRVHLHRISWADYEVLRAALRGEQAK